MTYDARDDWIRRQLRYKDWSHTMSVDKTQSRFLKMLRPLKDACKECTMCRLGNMSHSHRGENIEEPHVFSNMNPTKFMVVGQNPGYNECMDDQPFVGDAGKNFNNAIMKHGVTRGEFYISNIVRCHTPDNRRPEIDEISICESFLKMEIKLLRPTLVVALGAVAFEALCPGNTLSDSLGKIADSEKFGVKVYAVYHPSPRNMAVKSRKEKFDKDIEMLCKIVKRLKGANNEG